MSETSIEKLFASLTDLDTALPVPDVEVETLNALSDRLERSTLPRHFLLREAELDDLWRAAEAILYQARVDREDPARLRELEHLLLVAMRAHDLAGEGRVAEAMQTLRHRSLPSSNGEGKV
jgi:hypothetical protein